MELERSVDAVEKEVPTVVDVSSVSEVSMVVVSMSDIVIKVVVLSKEHIGPQLHAVAKSVSGMPSTRR